MFLGVVAYGRRGQALESVDDKYAFFCPGVVHGAQHFGWEALAAARHCRHAETVEHARVELHSVAVLASDVCAVVEVTVPVACVHYVARGV